MKDSETPIVIPTLPQLFFGISLISAQGIGGVLVFARREFVERKRWMTAEEFTETFAFAQLLPGPNVVNLAVIYGQRHHGVVGAVLAFLGMLAAPCALVMLVGAIYAHFADIESLRRILNGISVVASGLILAVVLKISMPLARRRSIRDGAIVAAVFVCAGLLRLPLIVVLAASLPVSLALVYWSNKRAAAR